MRGAVIYRIASWTGIAAGLGGVLAAYYERWLVAIGLGLLAVVCEPDVAMLTMQGASVPVTPTTIAGADYKPAVGEEIAICGYAHGSILLRRGKTIDRFGPLLLPGWISALSPFDVPRPGLLLLSLVAARCASGSPVFHRATGQVIGVLVEGQEGKGAIVSVARALLVKNGQIMARVGRIRVVERGPEKGT